MPVDSLISFTPEQYQALKDAEQSVSSIPLQASSIGLPSFTQEQYDAMAADEEQQRVKTLIQQPRATALSQDQGSYDLRQRPTGIGKSIAALNQSGQGLMAITADTLSPILELIRSIGTPNNQSLGGQQKRSTAVPSGNLQAIWDSQGVDPYAPVQLPVEKAAQEAKGIPGLAARAGVNIVESIPKIAVAGPLAEFAGAGATALGAGRVLAGAASGAAQALPFVTSEQGKVDPIGLAVMTALPGVAALGSKAAEMLANTDTARKFVASALGESRPILNTILNDKGRAAQFVLSESMRFPWLTDAIATKVVQKVGEVGAINLYLDAVAGVESLGLPPEQRGQAIKEAVAHNLAFSALVLPGIFEGVPRDQQIRFRESITPAVRAQADKVAFLLRLGAKDISGLETASGIGINPLFQGEDVPRGEQVFTSPSTIDLNQIFPQTVAQPQEPNATNPVQFKAGDIQKYIPPDERISRDGTYWGIAPSLGEKGATSIGGDSGAGAAGQPPQIQTQSPAGEITTIKPYEQLPVEQAPAQQEPTVKAPEAKSQEPATQAKARMVETTPDGKKESEEQIEQAAIVAARNIAQTVSDPLEAYRQIVKLYEAQPRLGTRTVTSKVNQAYSTPAPLAYLAGQLADLKGGETIAEPTAGNGMLLIGAPNGAGLVANEIDQGRNARLQSIYPEARMSMLDASGQDFHDYLSEWKPDRAVMNPPFGGVLDEGAAGNKRFPIINAVTAKGDTPSIDLAIALNTLNTMSDNGKAVVIIGSKTGSQSAHFGSPESRARAYNRPEMLEFFKRFNVVDWFTVGGNLYEKMGAGWPVDVLVIDGKKPTLDPKNGGLQRPWITPPPVFNSWSSLESKIYESKQRAAQPRPAGEPGAPAIGSGSGTLAGAGERKPVVRPPRIESVGEPSGNVPTVAPVVRPEGPQKPVETVVRPSVVPATRPEPAGTGGEVGQPAGIPEKEIAGRGALVEGTLVLNVPFVSVSNNVDPKLVVPANIADAMVRAVQKLQQGVKKPVDDYLAEKLGWSKTELFSRLSSAQIEAVALFVRNSETRKTGLINSDGTGVGKGRTVASVIEYARKTGKIPVFITQGKHLYSDMVGRDLTSIGNKTFTPFITDAAYIYEDGQGREISESHGSKDRREAMREIGASGELPKGFDGIFTTYFQLQSDKPEGFSEEPKERFKRKKKLQARQDGARLAMLRKLAPNSIFVLDEAHMAAGSDSDVGLSLQSILKNAAGVYYASATFAKRPDNLTLYAIGTAIRLAKLEPKAMTANFQAGGVPMQQALTSMLAEDGEFVRREQDMQNVKVVFRSVTDDPDRERDMADIYTSYLRELHVLSDMVNDAAESHVDNVNQVTSEESQVNLTSTNFGSRLFNLSNQYLFALRAEATAGEAVAALKRGQKPFIAVFNTMAGPIADLQMRGLPINFGGLLRREMAKMLEVKIKDPSAEADKPKGLKKGERLIILTPEDLADGGEFYHQLEAQIEVTDFSGMPISPIDTIKNLIRTAGYSIGEITAREGEVDETGGVVTVTKRQKQERNKVLSEYNNGALDALIVNGSGSTGLSAHTDPRFKDHRQRYMIVAQPAPDINVFMQMFGRVMRFGQTSVPEYLILTTSLAAERRFMTMLRGKLTSLNANTSAETESGITQGGLADDIFNFIGDDIVVEVMRAHPDLAQLARINLLDPKDSEGSDNYARYATGKFVLLPDDDAKLLWRDISEIYASRIKAMDEAGENPLKANVQDLKAKTTGEAQIEPGTGDTAFDGPVKLERVDIQPTNKPYTHAEATAIADQQSDDSAQKTDEWLNKWRQANQTRLQTMRDRSMADEQIMRAEKVLRQTYENVLAAVGMLGKTVGVDPTMSGESVFYAVPVDFELKSREIGDFSSSSKHTITLLTNTLRRRINLPLSQLQSLIPAAGDPAEVFDGNAESNTTRYVVTGNLLRGYTAAVAMSQNITRPNVTMYSTRAEDIKTGVLLGPAFNPETGKSGVKRIISGLDEFTEAINAGKPFVAGSVVITGTDVRVPSSGAFKGTWGDPAFNRLFARSPVEKGGEFLGVISTAAIPDLFRFIQAKGLAIREKSGEEDKIVFRDRQSIATTTGTGLSKEQVQTAIAGHVPRNAPAVHVIDSAEAERLGNPGAEGFTHGGEIYLVHDFISSAEQARDVVLREELVHIAVDNPQAQFELDALGTDYVTDADLQSIEDMGYHQEPGESDEAYKRRKTEEFIAKQELGNTSWWQKFLQRIVEWLKKAFGISLSKTEVLRAWKRKWLSRMNEPLGTSARQSLVKTKAEAVNVEKLVRTPDERRKKAGQVMAQGEIHTFLVKHGAGSADVAVKRALNYSEYEGIKNVGTTLAGGPLQDYRQLKAGLAGDPYQQKHLALIAATRWRLAQVDMESAIDAGQKAFKEITSKSFGVELARLAKADARKAAAEYQYTLSKSVFDSAIFEATKALKTERLSDIDQAKLEGHIKEIQESKDSLYAIGQIMEDMVQAVSNLPNGYDLLNDPAQGDMRTVRDAYTAAKIASGQPLHDPRLVEWSARLLARSSELRQSVLAGQLSQQSNVRSALGPYAASLATELEADPVAAVKKWRSEAVKLSTAQQKAAFVYRQIHDKVTEAMERYSVDSEAATIAKNFLDDPYRKALVLEIRADVGIDANKPSILPLVGEEMMLPSGRTIELNAKTGDALRLKSKRREIKDAVDELENHLLQNPLDENYGEHLRNLQTLLDFYAGSMLLNPQADRKFFNRGFGILRQAANLARSVVGEQFRKALAMHDTDYMKASKWCTAYGPKFTIHRMEAIKSHGMPWGTYFGVSLEERNQEYLRRIGNELASGHSNGEHTFRVGDPIGQDGHVVTKEDMADLAAQSAAATHGHEMIGERQVTERTMGGVPMYGKAAKTQRLMVPRVYEKDMTLLAEQFVVLQKEHVAAIKSKNQHAISITRQALFDFLEARFDRLAYQFVSDRSDQFAFAGPFDGQGQAFQQVTALMQRNPTAIASFDQLYEQLSRRSSLSKDESADWVLNEYARLITQFDSKFKEDKPIAGSDVRADETQNSFTRSRNEALAPFGFYRNGFQTSADVFNFAAGMASRSHDAVVAGLRNVIADFDRQIGELTEKERQGIRRVVAIGQQAVTLHNGKNYDDYRALEARRNKVQGMLENFTGNRQLTDIDNALARTVGALTGTMMSSFTTLRNYTTGPYYLGRVFNQLMASYWRSYPMAMWNIWVNQGLLRYGLSAAYGVPKAFTFDLLYGLGEGLYGLGNPATRSAGNFISKTFGRMLDELGTNIFMRVKDYRERVASGDQIHTDHRAEANARFMGGWMSNGHIHGAPMSGIEKFLTTPAALIEITLNTVNRPINPTLGDATINSGASTFMKSSAGPVAMHESALRRIFRDWKKSGYRSFDFSDPGSELNTLTHQEMFPNILRDPLSLRFITGREDMTNMLRFYRDAGIDFHVKAAEFLRELNSGNKAAILLTNEEIDAMVSWAIAKSNRATKTNTPLAYQNNNPITILARPFQFWNTRIFSTMIEAVAIPSQSGKQAKSTAHLKRIQIAQWAFWSLMVLSTVLVASMVGVGDEAISRAVSSAVYNQQRAYRQPWEREGAKSQAIGWALAAANLVPYVNMVATAALNDLPGRTSFDPSLVMVEKAKSAAQYVGGVIQSGNPTYRLPEFISGMFPDARIVLNRLESQEGKRELSNVAALGRRLGPQDLLRPSFGKGSGVNVTELTPYGNRMANAAVNGDWAAFDSIRKEAVNAARKLGKPNPDRLVEQIYSARDPLRGAFRTKLTPEQESAFTGNVPAGQADRVSAVRQRFQQGAERLRGLRPTSSNLRASRSTSRTPRLLGFGSRARLPKLVRLSTLRAASLRKIRLAV